MWSSLVLALAIRALTSFLLSDGFPAALYPAATNTTSAREMIVRTACIFRFVVFILPPMELSAGCVLGRSRESSGMKIFALPCYLTTVIWLLTYFQTLCPAVERLWLSDPNRFLY